MLKDDGYHTIYAASTCWSLQGTLGAAPLIDTNVSLQALFNATDATVGEVLSLQPGDVIRLAHPVRDSLTVMVEHLPKFRGYIGTSSSRYALRIADVIKEDERDE